MASVNITCAACNPRTPCEQCRAIERALRDAGHAITQTTRYDALRAAAVGAYGFDACVIPVAAEERAVVDAAQALLTRSRVALVVPSGAHAAVQAPSGFVVIEAQDFRNHAFPTAWIASGDAPARASASAPGAVGLSGELEIPPLEIPPLDIPPPGGPTLGLDLDLDAARSRLRHVARGALSEIAATGFPADARLDLLAALEDEIAWAKMSGTGFGMVLVHWAADRARARSAARVRPRSPAAAKRDSERVVGALRERIRACVRTGDVVAQSTDSVMALFAEAALEQTSVAVARIKKTLRKTLKELGGETGDGALITIGSAVYPIHGTTRAALLARATASASTP